MKWLPSTCLLIAGCYYASAPTTGGPDAGTGESSELPCEASRVLVTCWGCHSDPPRGGAPMSLVHLADLTAMSGVQPGASFGQRAVARLRDPSRPMPPFGTRPSTTDIDAFAMWVDRGMPAGTCQGMPPPDAGPVETVCTSGQFWPPGNVGSPDMNPGLACRACHTTSNPSKAFFFMGTVFPTLHEKDRCISNVPAGTYVEIIDANGQPALNVAVRRGGNFMSTSRFAGIALPFTVRLVSASGATSQMHTPQMTGDCNGCHTELGANGAPGRIVLPN